MKHEQHEEYVNICRNCDGSGYILVCRNKAGDIDYLDGLPTEEATECVICRGEGVEL